MTQVYTFDSDVVSDLHKDAYGFRPNQIFWHEWNSTNDDGRQHIWDNLLVSLNAEMERERRAEQQAISRFEALVTKTIAAGARNRETALRWIMDSSDCNSDWKYLCFTHGLPFHYFKKVA